LQISTVAGPEWLRRALVAASRLSGEEDVGEDDGVLALQHVYAVVEPLERVKSADVLTELAKREDAPWAKRWEAKLARGELKGPAADLARMLRPFGVRPKQLWIEERKERGYEAEDFRAPHVSPYLQKTVGTVKTVESASFGGASSTVPTGPTEFSGGAREGMPPRLGDEMFPVLLANAVRDGHITEAEAETRHALHRHAEQTPHGVCRCSSPLVEVDEEGDRYCVKCTRPLEPPRTLEEILAENTARKEHDRRLYEGDEGRA